MTAPRPRWLVIAVLAASLAVNVGWVATHLAWLRPLAVGAEAPPFALPRIEAGGAPGATVELSALRGRVVVVEFWATWCGPCLRALPVIDAAARRWGDQVVVIAVNVDDRAKARALFDAEGYRLTLVADDGETSARYGAHTLPHTVVIDRAGAVVAVPGHAGAVIAAVERARAQR